MERMYRALWWLAASGVVAGLIIVMLLAQNANQASVPGASGWFTVSWFTVFWLPSLSSVAEYFNEGAALMAVAIAWADRRQGWLVALGVVAVGAILFPIVIAYLLASPELGGPNFLAIHPRVGAWLNTYSFTLFNVASLIPAALALAFAWRRGAARVEARAQADAALEITRSAL